MAPDKQSERVSRRSDDLRGITSTVYDQSYPLYTEPLSGILSTRSAVHQASHHALQVQNLEHVIEGNSSYNSQPYGNPSYDSQPYGNPSYGNPSYGNPSYGNPSYGNSSYGTRYFGNTSYSNATPDSSSYQPTQLQEYVREPQRRDQLFRLDDLTEVRFETRPSSSKKRSKKSRR